MILFSTRSASHLASKLPLQQGRCTIKQFSDGELFVRIEEDVKNKQVWVLAATQPPAEHLLELYFLLDALQRAGARINLFITYFSYARQVTAQPGEALSAQVISTFLKDFMVQQTHIMHPHSILLHDFLPFKAAFDIDFFCSCAQDYDVIAAPDAGAAALAEKVADACSKELITLTKVRPEHEQAKIVAVDGSVARKKVLLVDDIIATGHTIAQAAQALMQHGAVSVAAAATHGIFSGDAYQILASAPLATITVTNTIAQKPHPKIKVYDVSAFIKKSISNTLKTM